jgi:hypothetical protein
LRDALTLESEVTPSIAHEVGIKLTPQVQRRLEYKPTTNPEAREAYLRGRYFVERDDAEGALKCRQYLSCWKGPELRNCLCRTSSLL